MTNIKEEVKEVALTEDQAREYLDGQKDFIKSEFKRLGFKEARGNKVVMWTHDGENDRMIITIDKVTNSIRYAQYIKNGEEWDMVPASFMAPLPELIEQARTVYTVSLKTRGLNKDWDMSKTHIVPGTEGSK